MKKLPIGIQSFVKMREDNFYYVDKTKYIRMLVDEGAGYYFLSRPRRFGKSLFLDTIKQAFLARKELFEGLYLENNWERIDLTVRFDGRCYIFKFKVVEKGTEGKALEQIKEKKYHEKYKGKCSEIYLIGVEFSEKDRNIVGFEYERVS